MLEAIEPDAVDEKCGALMLGSERHALFAQPETDIVAHRQPGKQRVALEHHAAIRAGSGDRLAVEQHAAGAGRVEPGDDAQAASTCRSPTARGW